MSLSKYLYLPYSQVLITVALIMYMKLLYLRAAERTRTSTGLLPPAPQAGASTIPPLPQNIRTLPVVTVSPF